jgi:hypothetical protein
MNNEPSTALGRGKGKLEEGGASSLELVVEYGL